MSHCYIATFSKVAVGNFYKEIYVLIFVKTIAMSKQYVTDNL